MKVLHIAHNFHPCVGGIERYIEDLCKNLVQLGHESDVVCLNTCPYSKTKLPEYEEYDGIKVWRVPYLDLKYYKIAPGVIKHFSGYDVLHVHGLGFFSDFIVLTKFLHKKPIILSTHGGIFHTSKIRLLKNLYFYGWGRLVARGIDGIFAHSKNDQRLFSSLGNPRHIPYCIYMDAYEDGPKEDIFLFVGRVYKNKRIDRLIRAIAELKKVMPDVRLEVVGGDWGDQQGLINLAKELGVEENVSFEGEKVGEELMAYYKRAKYFVSASEYEGFGISVIEAMAAGCVPIVSNITAFGEFIEDGKNGFMADFSDAGSAAVRIQKIVKSDLSDVVSAGKETAAGYSWDKIIGKVEKIYKSVL